MTVVRLGRARSPLVAHDKSNDTRGRAETDNLPSVIIQEAHDDGGPKTDSELRCEKRYLNFQGLVLT